jgi:hypothetical protein
MSHNLDKNVGRESDGRVLPTKCPNKGGSSTPAESMEGRRPTKENTGAQLFLSPAVARPVRRPVHLPLRQFRRTDRLPYAFTVTVSNTTNAMVLPWPTMPGIPGFPWPRGALLLLAGMAVVLFARSAYRTGRQTCRLMLGFAVFLLVLLSLNGCGGGGGGRPPTNATLTIIGSSGSVKHTLNLSLTINH